MTVWLVGAGPGDPELVTVRGLELIRSCEALVVDALVAPELVEEAPEGALVVPREGLSQSELNKLLVELGTAGLDVVRLKGGDPFVFGRGGEEAEALAEAGIPFEVVPGVSALAAVPGSALIPVTHRGISTQVTIVSGHSASGDALDFAQLAATPGTLVVFMGLGRLGPIAEGLVSAGRSERTSAAVISSGTRNEERTVYATLADIAALASELEQPALLVVGDVVAVGRRLASKRGVGLEPARR